MIIHDIEQRSEEWFKLRAGMPTASMFSKLVTGEGKPSKQLDGYALTLAGAIYAGKELDSWEGNKWTERGTELEDDARSLYEFANDVEIQQAGFITDDEKLYGCSPDGLVGDNGMIEIKCLKAENHIKAILDHQKDGKFSTEYILQVQGQMMIAERKWCDLIFYHPELPLLVIRIEPWPEITTPLLLQIAKVLEKRDEIVTSLNKMVAE